MTTGNSRDRKEVIFVNQAALSSYDGLPPTVRETADARLTVLQNGDRLPTNQVTILHGTLQGVSEIRVGHDGDAYRVYFAAEFGEVIYLLDAGIKKSPKSKEIPREQIARIEERFRRAKAHYLSNQEALKMRFEERKRNRDEA